MQQSAETQATRIEGDQNLIIQIRGDGNRVEAGLPHLKLTRFRVRRAQSTDEQAQLLSPYRLAIDLIGREQERTATLELAS